MPRRQFAGTRIRSLRVTSVATKEVIRLLCLLQ